eukprot:gene3932-2535_t
MVRLARVLRMLKLGKNLKSIQVMMVALSRAKIALVLMCMLMLMTIVFYSSLMYFLERVDPQFDKDLGEFGMWVYETDSIYNPNG